MPDPKDKKKVSAWDDLPVVGEPSTTETAAAPASDDWGALPVIGALPAKPAPVATRKPVPLSATVNNEDPNASRESLDFASKMMKLAIGAHAQDIKPAVNVNEEVQALSQDHVQLAKSTAKKEIEASKQYVNNFLSEYQEPMSKQIVINPSATNPMQTMGANASTQGMFDKDNYANKLFDVNSSPEAMSQFIGNAKSVLNDKKEAEIQTLRDQYLADKNSTEPFLAYYEKGKRKIEDKWNKKQQELLQATNSLAALKTVNSEIEKVGASRVNEISPLEMGMRMYENTGNAQQVKRDREAIARGKKLDPETKVAYENSGYQAMQHAVADQFANDRIDVAKTLADKTDNYQKKVIDSNPEFVKQQRIKALSAQIYKDENAILSAVADNDPSIADIKAAAAKLGWSQKDIEGITPADIQNPKVWYKRLAGSFINNSAGGIYKLGMRGVAGAYDAAGGDVDWDAFNEHYNEDWYKNQSSVLGGKAMLGGDAPNSGLFEEGSGVDANKGSDTYLQNVKNQNAANFTWDPRAILNQVADGAGQIAAFGYAGGKIGELAKAAGVVKTADAAQKVGTVLSTYLTQYADNYSAALDAVGTDKADEGKRNLYAFLKTTSSAVTELILPDAKIMDNLLGPGTKAGAELINMIKRDGVKALQGDAARTIIKKGLKEGIIDWQKEISEDVLDQIGGYIIDSVMAPEKLAKTDVASDLKQTYITSAISSLLPTVGGAMNRSRNASKMQKSIMFEVGSNPETYIDDINAQLADGKITPADAKERISVINNLSDIVDNQVPEVSPVTNKPLTPSQKLDYTQNLASESLLTEQEASVKDIVQKNLINTRIEELQKEREEILGVPAESKIETQDAATNTAPTVQSESEPAKAQVNISDFANPDEFYRVLVGDAAFNDIVESGVVRTNANSKNSNKEEGTIDLGGRPTAFPSFSKGKASIDYAQANPNNYIVVTNDESIQPSNVGRHGRGTTMFPTDAEGNHLKELDGKKVRVYKHVGEDNYELVYENGKPVAQENTVKDEYQSLLDFEDEGDNLTPSVQLAPASVEDGFQREVKVSEPEATPETSARVQEINNLRPKPIKPLDQMTGDELNEHYRDLNDFNKQLDKKIFGDEYEKYAAAQRLSNASNIAASDPRLKESYKTVDEMEAALPKDLRDLLYGVGTNGVVDQSEVKDMYDAVSYVESSENLQELAQSVRGDIITLGNAPANVADYNSAQERARMKLIAAKRRAGELGISTSDLTEAALKTATGEFSDMADAELMLGKYFNQPAKESAPQENAPQAAIEAPQRQESAPVQTEPVEKPIDYKTKAGNRVFRNEKGYVVVTNKKGEKPKSQQTVNTSLIEYAEQADLATGEMAPPTSDYTPEHVAATSNSPAEIAAHWMSVEDAPPALDMVENAIANFGPFTTSQKSFERWGDKNNIGNSIARSYIEGMIQGPTLDQKAEEISNQSGIEVSPVDLAHFMIRFPNGVEQATQATRNPVKDALVKRFEQVTGLTLLDNETGERIAGIALSQYEGVMKYTKAEKQLLNNDYESTSQLIAEYEGAIASGEINPSTEDSGPIDSPAAEQEQGVPGAQSGEEVIPSGEAIVQDGESKPEGEQGDAGRAAPVSDSVAPSWLSSGKEVAPGKVGYVGVEHVRPQAIREVFPELFKAMSKYSNTVWDQEDLKNLLTKMYSTLYNFKKGSSANLKALSELEQALAAFKDAGTGLTKQEVLDKIANSKYTDEQKEILSDFIGKVKGEKFFYLNTENKSDASTNFYSLSENLLQSPSPEVFVHEVGHFGFYNLLSPQERLDFYEYAQERFYGTGNKIADEMAWGKPLEIGDKQMSTNVADNFSEYFAEQFRQYYFAEHTTPKKIASLYDKLKSVISEILSRFKEKGYNPELTKYFDKIVDSNKPSESKKEAAPTGLEADMMRRNTINNAITIKERRLELMETREDRGSKQWQEDRKRTQAEVKNAMRIVDELDKKIFAAKKETNAEKRKTAAKVLRSLKIEDKKSFDEAGNDITPVSNDIFGGLPKALYNTALEKIASFIEDDNKGIVESIQLGIDYINSRYFKTWDEQKMKDAFKVFESSDPNNPADPKVTAQSIRDLAASTSPLSAKNQTQADALADKVINNEKTLDEVLRDVNMSNASATTKKKVSDYIKQKVDEVAYRVPGGMEAADLLARNNNDFDAAMKELGANYDAELLASTNDAEKENLRKRYAATKTVLDTEKTKAGYANGTITPVSIHQVDNSAFVLPSQANLQKRRQQLQDRYVRLQQAQDLSNDPISEDNDAVAAFRTAKAKAWNTINEIRDYLGDSKVKKGTFYDRLSKAGIDIEKFGLYLYAKHAPERNAQNAKTRQEAFDAKVYGLNQAIAQGNPTKIAEWQDELDKILAQQDPNFILMEDGGSGMTNDQAKEIINEVEADGDTAKYEQFAREFKDNVVDKILEAKYESGLLKDEEYASILDAYENYVPLKIDMDAEAGNSGGIPDLKNTGRTGRDLYRSKGGAEYTYVQRNNVVLQAVSDLEHSVLKGEENKANIRMANLIRANENPAIWEVRPAMNEAVTGKDGTIKFMREINRPATGIPFWENGNKSYIILNDPGLAETFRKLPPNVLLKTMQNVTGFVRTFATLSNPSFIVTNPLLDMQDAIVNIMGEKNPELTKAYLKNISLGGKIPIAGHMKIVGQILSGKGEWNDIRKEWEKEGGKVTFLSQVGLEDQAKKNLKIFEDYGKSKANPKMVFNAMKSGLQNFSEALEIATRLAIYKSGKDVGLTNEKSAILSRDATIDFEKSGSYGVWLNAWKAFANAAVQGSANLFVSAAKSKKVRALLAGTVVFGIAQAGLADLLSDCKSKDKEDCFWEVPEYRKQKAIIIPMKLFGGQGFASIPIGRHFGWLNYLGQSAYGLIKNQATNGERGNGAADFTKNMITSMFSYYNPLGGDSPIEQQMAGNFAPVVAGLTNKNTFGSSIVPDNVQHLPDHSNYFPSTPSAFVATSKFLSESTGGSDARSGAIDISPNTLDFILQSGFSGFYGFVKKTAAIPGKATSEKGVKFGDIPVLDRFYRESNMSITKGKTRDLIEKSETDLLTQKERDDLVKHYGELVKGDVVTEESAGKALNYMNKNQTAIINREKKKNADPDNGEAKPAGEAKEARPAKGID